MRTVHVNNLDCASSQCSNLLENAVEKAAEDRGAASTQKIFGTYPTEAPVGGPGDAVEACAGQLLNTAIVMPSEAGAGEDPDTGTTENPGRVNSPAPYLRPVQRQLSCVGGGG